VADAAPEAAACPGDERNAALEREGREAQAPTTSASVSRGETARPSAAER
jgi:hypothetical protein